MMPAHSGAAVHHLYGLDQRLAESLRNERLRRQGAYVGGQNPWTQRAVAARMGITAAALCQWETSRSYPTTLTEWGGWAKTYRKDLAEWLADLARTAA